MSTKKIVCGLVLLLIAVGLAFVISGVFLVVALLASAVILAILRRLPGQKNRVRLAKFGIIILGIVTAVIFVIFVRSHPPASCQNSLRGFMGGTSDKPRMALERLPAAPQLDFQRAIDAEGLELFQHAVASKKSGAVLNSARATLTSLTGELSGDDSSKLSSGIESLQKAVDSLNHDALEARTERLKEFVSEKREQAKKADDQQEFLDKFEMLKTDEKWSFEDVYSKMMGLQDLVARFVNNKVKDRITTSTVRLTARLEEQKNTVIYEEKIGIVLGVNITLRQVDFSELQLKEQFTGMRQSILYSFDNGQPVATNSGSISVPDGVRQLTVLNQVTTSANIGDACNAPGRLPFRRFFVKWPDAAPTSIGLQLNIANLAGRAGSVPYYYRQLIDKKSNIDEIEIPDYSFFNSNYRMEDTKGMPGGISPDPPVSAANSSVSQPIEIDLLPNSRVFRNSPVQGAKRYLFPLNALVSLVVLVLGWVFSWVADAIGKRVKQLWSR